MLTVIWFQIFNSNTNNLHTIIWFCNWAIGLMSRVFANGLGDRGSILGRVIPKTQKMVLDTTLLNTQHYKVRIKGKVEQSWEWSSALPLHLGVVAIEKGAFGSPLLLRSPTLLVWFCKFFPCNCTWFDFLKIFLYIIDDLGLVYLSTIIAKI